MPIQIPTKEEITAWNRANTPGGGSVINEGALTEATEGPNAGFGGHDLIDNWPEKIVKVIRAIAQAHPFKDGNKRTATWAVQEIYRRNGVQNPPTDTQIEKWVDAYAEETPPRKGGEQERAILEAMNESVPTGQHEWHSEAADSDSDEKSNSGDESDDEPPDLAESKQPDIDDNMPGNESSGEGLHPGDPSEGEHGGK